MKRATFLSVIAGSLLIGLPAFCAEPSASVIDKYVFTDEKAVVQLPPLNAATTVEYSVKTLTRTGFGPVAEGKGSPVAGRFQIAPLGEGVHTVELKTQPPQKVRFLAMRPPTALNKSQLLKALPRSGRKLLSGQPFKFLSMGDSVTNTGDYETLLVKLLARSTGNQKISFVDRSYSGRSIDASVRQWVNDGPPNKPDLGLIMYGLNDQITNVPLDAFLEQYAWLSRQLAGLGADTAFLQPTPDIGIPVTPEQRKPDSNEPSYIIRTLNFGEALRPLAKELKVPLAETFGAVWGSGGSSLEDSARQMWPLFPPGYSRQMESLIETGDKGDTIHPNVLGHLQIARAVYAALGGAPVVAPSPWQWQAVTRWTPTGPVSTITARNTSTESRSGRLEVHPPTGVQFKTAPVPYHLARGQQIQFVVTWPQATWPADLLSYPSDVYLADGRPLVPIVDFSGRSSRVYGVTAPFQPQAAFVRTRQTVKGHQTSITYKVNGKNHSLPVTIPEDSDVGRIPFIQPVSSGKLNGYAVGEVAYVRYGAARTGEATVDGDLTEWQNAIWTPLGEPVQARSWRGLEDNRPNPQEFYQHWAFKAGREGVHLAVRTTGNIEKDTFTLFFDSRPVEQLGTVGRYYWVSGSFKNGQIALSKGETSEKATGLKSAWKKTENGATIELFVPYYALDITAWPESGDLGASLVWTHFDNQNKRTALLWSENGHWWNPRWFGVIRRTDEDAPLLPFMVRVR